MAVAVVEQPMTQICHSFETMKIDAHRKAGDKTEFLIKNQHFYPNYVGENFHSSASVASSDMIGDGASSYCSREEYPELAYVTTNSYAPSHSALYAGCPSPVMNAHSYMPYQVDGIHYYNQIVDYNFPSQPVFGSVPTNAHYPTQGNDGFVYGPQVYQYPVQSYYQQPSIGQYVPGSQSMPTGGMVVLEPQDSSVVLTNGYSNYAGSIPAGPPSVTFAPPISCEIPALPISVSYAPLPAAYPSHTLRASAPAWIEPTHEVKGGFKERKPVEAPSGPQQSTINGIYPPNKAANTVPSNGVLLRSNSTPAAVKVVPSPHSGPASLPTHGVIDVKENSRSGIEKAPKKDLSLSAVAANGQDNGLQSKLQQLIKPLPVMANKDSCPCLPNGERYNSEDFVMKYDEAKHFIIKSYSEENVFRSIQYGVWASTPNGNKKLDDAYHDAQRRAAGEPRGCPIFLFFSVNGSRQFCGVAEMIGPVDYKRSMEFWEQHKWSGSFPLKWHFIKDVPNAQFRRIILANNENKPVTNSRDTQEVFYQQGLEMLNIIKSYPARTSILDEFPLCNMPMKAAPDVRVQPLQHWSPQSFPKISEQVKLRNEEPDVKGPRISLPASKVCDNGGKVTHVAKPVQGKVLSSTAGQEPTNTDKEKRRLDKENIKLAGKDGALIAS